MNQFAHTDIEGRRFGRLVAYWRLLIRQRGFWLCICDCGKLKLALYSALASNRLRSCGCIRTPDPLRVSAEYEAWRNMRQRCTNPNHPQFTDWGGRGITVCERWSDFDAFFADMGAKPTPAHTIERENNNLGYSPDNCKWATWGEQSRNRRDTKLVTHNGVTMCASDWAHSAGMRPTLLISRINAGWDMDAALTLPLNVSFFKRGAPSKTAACPECNTQCDTTRAARTQCFVSPKEKARRAWITRRERTAGFSSTTPNAAT